jgi:hypothetical protein
MYYTDTDLAKVRSAGVTMSRIDVTWSGVEPSPGTWKWSSYDSMFTKAAQHDITILPILEEPPSWAEASWNVIPTNPANYAQYVAAVVARYGPNGTFWKANPSVPYRPAAYFELWNEPYWYLFNQAGTDPGVYARMVKAAGQAGKAANPDAKFLIEADLTGYETSSKQVEWIDTMYSAVPDLNNWFDGVAVHPYSQPRAPDVYSPGARWDFERIKDIHQKFINHSAGDKPFWLTEIGWPTCTADASKCVSESVQASDTQQMFQILKTSDFASFVKAVFLYNYRDPSSQTASNMENWFGLLRGDGSAKPVWSVLQHATGAA